MLVGPSGCGKTTALRMIAGLEEITGGDLYIGDRRVNDVAPKDRDIAMVFQSYALYPHMSVYDNMAFGLKLRKRPKPEIERRVKEAARAAGPAEPAAAQAEAALGRPAPARRARPRHRARAAGVPDGRAALEPGRQAARRDARRADQAAPAPADHDGLRDPRPDRGHDHGPPHRRDAATACCSSSTRPQTLYDRPANLFVAGFIGSPAMNFFPGQLAAENGGHELWVQTSGLKLKLPEAMRAQARRAHADARSSSASGPSTSTARAKCATAIRTRTATVNVSGRRAAGLGGVRLPVGQRPRVHLAHGRHGAPAAGRDDRDRLRHRSPARLRQGDRAGARLTLVADRPLRLVARSFDRQSRAGRAFSSPATLRALFLQDRRRVHGQASAGSSRPASVANHAERDRSSADAPPHLVGCRLFSGPHSRACHGRTRRRRAGCAGQRGASLAWCWHGLAQRTSDGSSSCSGHVLARERLWGRVRCARWDAWRDRRPAWPSGSSSAGWGSVATAVLSFFCARRRA